MAEIFFDNFQIRIVEIVFWLSVIYLIYHYFIFKKKKKNLPEILNDNDPRKEKWYFIIFALEGIAILILKNVLVNINEDYLFISCFTLIVGIHFIPLATIFNRKFDYYIAAWTVAVSIVGIFLITVKKIDYKIINGLTCTGCAISTLAYGLKMISDGNRIVAR